MLLKSSIITGLLLNSLFAGFPPAPIHDEEAERDFHSKAAALATGEIQRVDELPRSQWPVSVLSIGHTMASYQNYSGPSSAYFHHGLDIRADAGSDVIASRGGKVVNIENYQPGPKYWEVAILDEDGFLWQYHHVDPDSIPTNIHNALKSGEAIKDGTKIGEVVYWPIVSFGERYHHIHLNILGNGKQYVNPFAFLQPLKDNASPVIGAITLVQNGKKVSGNTVTGKYTIGAELKDLILSDVFYNPPNEIKFSVDGQPSETTWKFDKLPGGASNEDFVTKFFIPSLACGDYSCRKPVIDLGFRKIPAQVFPTSPGNHEVKIEISDFENNTTSKTFSWTVK